jgi:hypothetical protein
VRRGKDELAVLLSAVSAGDMETARHAMRWLAGRREATRLAAEAASKCASPTGAGARERTVVLVIVDGSLPDDGAVFATTSH